MKKAFAKSAKRETNIFAAPEWKNYDYQKDMWENDDWNFGNPVGKEKLD